MCCIWYDEQQNAQKTKYINAKLIALALGENERVGLSLASSITPTGLAGGGLGQG